MIFIQLGIKIMPLEEDAIPYFFNSYNQS